MNNENKISEVLLKHPADKRHGRPQFLVQSLELGLKQGFVRVKTIQWVQGFGKRKARREEHFYGWTRDVELAAYSGEVHGCISERESNSSPLTSLTCSGISCSCEREMLRANSNAT